jgi:hypothetical protein
MKRIPRDPVRFDVFRAFATSVDLNLHDQTAIDGFKASVDTSIKKSLENPKFLYGQHVQAMFQGVVIALGQVQMIKEEDAGGGWYDGDGHSGLSADSPRRHPVPSRGEKP